MTMQIWLVFPSGKESEKVYYFGLRNTLCMYCVLTFAKLRGKQVRGLHGSATVIGKFCITA